MKNKILRSLLYVPANSWRMIQNSVLDKADAVILDLEDAVAMEEKETARIFARDSLSCYQPHTNVLVRVNSLKSGLLEEDLAHVVDKNLDAVMLPKTEGGADITHLDHLLRAEEEKKNLSPGSVEIVPLIESPRGIEKVFEILEGSSRVAGVAFGAGDYLREMGVGFAVTKLEPEDYFTSTLYARSRLAIAAKLANIEAIDTPFFGLLIDIQSLYKESQSVKLLGFTGKQLVHPRHIETANVVFGPSAEEINYARSIIRAYGEAKAQGAGAASHEGRMIDYAMFKMGKDMLLKAEEIEKRDKGPLVEYPDTLGMQK